MKMERKYTMEFSHEELLALYDCLEFTDMMGDVDLCYTLKNRVEDKIAEINLRLNRR